MVTRFVNQLKSPNTITKKAQTAVVDGLQFLVASDSTVIPAIVKGGGISVRLSCASKLKPTASPRLFPVNCVPQLAAQVRPYVPLLTSIDALLLNSTQ
jgi:hypothetical protein